ncbi:DNA RNA polymerases superfamily [Olea europaea subsp. europaea]|uniref:DNA RNA polymerases superfamily n=1 Tax=Olea europaea subsp. europaea TaxID=158383 RepID=A0A8S0TPT9_OLEEU|nr:DNA RNA polymerases superfamily [Olea europaea subsp. europaea]
MGTKLKFSMAYHPQTDGQIEVVNRSLGNLLRCLVQENLRNWDLILPVTQIAYNSSINRSLGMSPFEAVHEYKPREPLDLIPMSPQARASVSAEAFAQHLRDLHIEINKQLEASNAQYKLQADLHKRHIEFHVGDYVMVRIRPERCLHGPASKLQARSAGPFKILKQIGPNASVVDIPPHLGYHSTFNVEDLVAYKGYFIPSDDPLLPPFVDLDPDYLATSNPLPPLTAHTDKIDVILNE